MVAKPWRCLCCRGINDPNEEFREARANICANCNRWRFLLPAISAGSLAVLAALTIGIIWLAGIPERTYRARHHEFLYNDNRIDEAEAAELTRLASKYHLSDDVIKRIQTDAQVAITFPTASPSPTATSDQLINPATRGEVVATLHNVYSDKFMTSQEHEYLAEQLARANISQIVGDQLELEVKTAWEHARPSFESGLNFTRRANYQSAIEELRLANEADHDNAWILANLGAAYSEIDHLDDSLKSYQRALVVDRRNWLAHYNLGSLKLREGDRVQAIQELSDALRFAAEDPTQHITKDEILEHMRSDKGLKDLNGDPRFMQLIAQN